MRTLRLFILLLVTVICGNVGAQTQDELNQLMRNRGEYYFTLSIDDVSAIPDFGNLCSIDGVKGKTVICYANQQEYDKLLALGLQPELETPPSMRASVTMWDGTGTYGWDSYLTYPQYVAMMEEFPSKALDDRTCEMFSLGTLSTSNHRQLLGVHIYKGEPYGKPRFLYSSTMHGDEVTGMILMLRLIDELCTSTDSRIVNLLNDVDIYILPLTNPDGTYAGGNNTVGNATRANGNSIDLNRNYQDYFNGDHPDGYSSYQNETQWTMDFGNEHLFTMGANYHGGAEVMNYCWDWVFQDHSDMDWYEYVSTEYVTLARQISSSYMGGYNYGSNNYDYDGVTNGATWYSITGSRQDYMNAYAQCREITVECSSTKTVSGSSLPTYWTYHHNCLLALMEQCRNGVHGVVYDATTGQTLQGVTVSVLNHDIHNAYVTTHEVGDFHRPIKGGTYTFIFDKEGYARKFVEVTVADDQRVDLTVNLTPSNETATECYEQMNTADIVTGPCFMGYLNGSTLVMPSHNDRSTTTSVSMSTTSLSVTLTDDGFTLPHDIDRQKIALEPSGTSGQYHILYKGRMLQRSNSSLVWAKPSNSSGSGVTLTTYNWYVNDNGVYYQSGSTKYYLNYSNGSFTTSTTNQNNITFYRERNCLPMEFTVTATAHPEEGGVIEGAGTYLEGETCTLTASPNEDYQFIHWTENGVTVSTDVAYSFDVTSNRTLVAVFGSTIPISVTVSASPARAGSVSGGGEYLYGQTCTVTANANTGWVFTNWTENGTVVSTEATYSFEVEEERDLVANFSYEATVTGDCYYTANSVADGTYVMGYINNETLMIPSHNNSSSVTITSVDVTPTDYGFSVEEGTTVPQVTLTAYGSNGQYYIKYNNRYLYASSNYNSATLSWTTSTNNSTTRWYINGNGIYVTTSGWNSNTYYLYYNNGFFALSTSQQNNITFYAEGDCPQVPSYTIAATASPAEGGTIDGADLYYEGETCVLTATANEGYTFVNWTEDGEEVSTEATFSFEVTGERSLVANFEAAVTTTNLSLSAGWNWFSSPVVADDLLAQIEQQLGANGVVIKNKNGKSAIYDATSNSWFSNLNEIALEQMYKIQTNAACDINLLGTASDPTQHPITIKPGANWIGFPVGQSMSVEAAMAGFEPSNGDVIKAKNGKSAIYDASTNSWFSNLTFEPGKGYIYQSNATENKTLLFPSGTK